MATASSFGLYDEYGFERPADFDPGKHEEFMSSYLPVLVRRGQRWENLLKSGGKDHQYKSIKHGGKKLKRFVRKGIPSSHRSQVWMITSGAEEMRLKNPQEYTSMLSIMVDPHSTILEQITIDLDRTFPKNMYFNKHDPKCLQQPLFNVLLAYSNHNPDIGYCQGMNYIAGLLLLVTKDEEKAYFLLRALTEHLLPEYYGPNIPGLMTDVKVLAELISMKCPRVYEHVESFNFPWASVCTKWFACLYVDVLPIETVLRVWDCLFNEGSKILFRVAILLVMMNQDKIVATKDFSELVTTLQSCTISDKTVQCHEFISTMFEMTSPLPSKTLERLRERFAAENERERLNGMRQRLERRREKE